MFLSSKEFKEFPNPVVMSD